jgi:hypothetical protein
VALVAATVASRHHRIGKSEERSVVAALLPEPLDVEIELVAEIAGLRGISRDTFYRLGHTKQEIERAYFTASGEVKRDLPDPRGLDSVQRANWKARKPTFESLQRNLYRND